MTDNSFSQSSQSANDTVEYTNHSSNKTSQNSNQTANLRTMTSTDNINKKSSDLFPPSSNIPSGGQNFANSDPSWFFKWFGRYHFLSKTFVIAFAFIVFTTVARHVRYHRDLISYIGIMLMITVAYLEILVIRDHLWVLEGALPTARRWREVFFNYQTLSRMRLRKFFAVLFSMVVFTYVYVKTQGSEIYSFLGIVLMITVLYFEVLAIRDDVQILVNSIRVHQLSNNSILPTNITEVVPPASPASSKQPTIENTTFDELEPKDDET